MPSSESTPDSHRRRAASGRGGNITVVSKSGSNRFTGSVFEYLRNDALDSASNYDDQKQELEFNQFGGSIGGPIVHE